MKIGYARVSTQDQNLEQQVTALKQAGCEKLYTEKVSGTSRKRPELDDMLRNARVGDTLVIWKLDRLGRSLSHLLSIVEGLAKEGIGFVSLTEGFDTSTSAGKAFFQMAAVFAEYERNLIQERTMAGLEAARLKGRVGGRPKTVTDEKIKSVTALSKTIGVSAACKQLNVNRQSYYRLRGTV